jgi:hypothetical protein
MLFKGQQIAVALGLWVMLELALLALFGSLDYAFFYVIAFLGFLVVAALASPYIAKPRWKTRLDFVAVAGTLAFGLIVAEKALVIWRTLK